MAAARRYGFGMSLLIGRARRLVSHPAARNRNMGTPAFEDGRALISGAAYDLAESPAMISVTKVALGRSPEEGWGQRAPMLHNDAY